jgi:hypothetical protein
MKAGEKAIESKYNLSVLRIRGWSFLFFYFCPMWDEALQVHQRRGAKAWSKGEEQRRGAKAWNQREGQK